MPFTLTRPGIRSYTDSLHSFLFPVNALRGEQNLPNLQNISKSWVRRSWGVLGDGSSGCAQGYPRAISRFVPYQGCSSKGWWECGPFVIPHCPPLLTAGLDADDVSDLWMHDLWEMMLWESIHDCIPHFPHFVAACVGLTSEVGKSDFCRQNHGWRNDAWPPGERLSLKTLKKKKKNLSSSHSQTTQVPPVSRQSIELLLNSLGRTGGWAQREELLAAHLVLGKGDFTGEKSLTPILPLSTHFHENHPENRACVCYSTRVT